MTKEAIIKSDNSFEFHFGLFIIGGIGFLFLGYYLISEALKDPYPQIIGIFIGSFFGIVGFGSLILLFSFEDLQIYSDRLEIRSIIRNTKNIIYLKDITSWTEVEKKGKDKKWNVLTIYTERTKYKLNSSIYNNYPQLKMALVNGKIRDIDKESDSLISTNKYGIILSIILSGACMYAAFHFYEIKDKEIKYSEIQTITGIISNKAEIHKGSRGSRSIKINLKSYPDFIFDIDGNAYSATYSSNFIANVKVGDTLALDILKNEYQMKLTKEKKLGFWDKGINYPFISVYGLRDKKKTYLNLSDYNIEHKNDTPIGIWFFGIIGLFIIGNGLRLGLKK